MELNTPFQQIIFQEFDAIQECIERMARVKEQIIKVAQEWRWAPTVKALQALRGGSLVTAVVTVTEIGDFSRFQNPKELMAYLGLVPSEHSRRQAQARWNYQNPFLPSPAS